MDRSKLVAGRDYISNNSISTYKKCPYKYNLEYIKKIKPIKKSITLYFGVVLHQTLDYHFSNPSTADETVEYFNSAFDGGLSEQPILWQVNGSRKDGGDFQDPESVKKYAEKAIRGYLEAYPERLEVLESESDFVYKLGGIDYTGIIDKIVKMGDKIYVLDHKTAAQKVDEDYLQIDPQISGYYLGAEALGYKVDGAIYDYIYKHKTPTFQRYFVERTPKQLESFIKNTKQAMKSLREGTIYQNISRECKTCNYWSYCKTGGELGDNYYEETK
jgi:CRISPR/Cas system-associated exonuclease Cas4 (RecB family)